MSTFSLTASLITHSLAWALLYSLWQGLLLYGTLYMLLKALPNMNARTRHYAAFGSLTALFIWFADTWLSEYQKLRGITVYITQPGNAPGLAPVPSITYATHTISPEHMQASILHRLLPHVEHYFPVIVLIYSLGLTFMLFRFLVNVLQLRAIKTRGLAAPAEYWNEFMYNRLAELDIARPVKLYLSDRINVPMMLGTLKPLILLPVATMSQLTTEQVEAILLHELAHIKRYDYLLNILQTIAETLLFFNPFVWLISAVIRREREHCCDDIVVSSNSNRLSYAKALAILEDKRIKTNGLAMAATGHKNQLLHRIKRIMEMKKNNTNNSKFTIVIVAVVALTITTGMLTFTPSFAQKAKTKKTTTTKQTKSSYKYKSVTIDSNGKKTVIERDTPPPTENDEKETNTNVNVTVNGGSGKSAATSTRSYSYSYTDNDADNLEKVIRDAVVTVQKTIEGLDLTGMAREIEREMENAQNEMNQVDWKNVRREIDRGIAEINKELAEARMNKKITIEVRKELETAKRSLEVAKKELERKKHIHMSATAGSSRNHTVTVTMNGNGDEDDEVAEGTPPEPPIPPAATAAPPATPVPIAAPAPPAMPIAGNRIESMLDQMEENGLIDRSKKYSVEKEDGKLYINGKKQNDATAKKYSKYLKGKSVSIKGHKNSLSIAIND